ncbi:MAG: hypothetical protein QXN16_00110 [Candidatus Micrarchaeaceae archaeon]
MLDKIGLMAYIAIALAAFILLPNAYASYYVKNINTTVYLNSNNSAFVHEAIAVNISNSSFIEYTIDRSNINLNLSAWQSLISPKITPHIINPRMGVYGLNLLPGPLSKKNGQGSTYIYLTYYVSNITVANQIAPRTTLYVFNASFLNFARGAGGAVLGSNTTLNIVLPNTSKLIVAYPLPDIVNSSTNAKEMLTWENGEPLYNFKLVFETQESLSEEVISFFANVYSSLGLFSYALIAAVIALIIFYTYVKTR